MGSPETSFKSVYARVWRWHFYAGLYVVPFLLMLAVTGLVMLGKGALDDWLYADRLFVSSPGPVTLSLDAQLEAVRTAFPQRTVTQITPSSDPQRSTEVLTEHAGMVSAVYVDPTEGTVLGEVLDSTRPGVVALLVHGTLLTGRVGDWMIELAAGLGVVLVVSGLFLWWPRGAWHRAFRVEAMPRRLMMRDLHKLTGALVAPVLVFYLVSGLTWTEVWGGRFTQAWSTFPAERSAPGGAVVAPADATVTHGDTLNDPGRLQAPWGIEQTPMPESDAHDHAAQLGGPSTPASAAPPRVSADQAVARARAHGLGNRFIVRVPAGPTGVWTVSATTMSGLLTDPRDELTVHVDQYSGDVRGVIGWPDYGIGARAMAVSVPLHQGSFGAWNVWLAALVCLAMIGLSVTGVLAWWWRRPSRAWRLVAPPLPHDVRAPRVAVVAAVAIGLAFPLVGLTFVAIAILDMLVVQRVPGLRAILD